MRRATSTDAAQAAGVSQATVSRAFTPGARISPNTREHVLKVAREIGYEPRGLLRKDVGGPGDIAIVMADITNPFFPEILEVLSLRLRQRGLSARFFSLPRGMDIDALASDLFRQPLAGVLFSSATLSSRLARICRDQGLPIVLLNRVLPGPDVGMVACDNYEGGRQVAELLLGTGRQRMAFIAGRPEITSSADRERGFVDGLAAAGHNLHASENGAFIYENALEAARRLFDRAIRPDAVFCASDVMAFATLHVLRNELRLRVPEDVSVVGFDDIRMASWPEYQLTTVRQRLDLMVDEAIDLLLRLTENPHGGGVTRLVTGTLIERGTTLPRAEARTATRNGKIEHAE